MKLSYSWLKDYLKCELSPAQVADAMTDIGIEVDSVEESEEIPETIPCVQLGGEKDGASVLAEVPESILGEIARLSLNDYSADEARAAILSAVGFAIGRLVLWSFPTRRWWALPPRSI